MDTNLALAQQVELLLLAVGGLCAINVLLCLLGAAVIAEMTKLAKRVDAIAPEGK